jgi:erythrin-vacuolar iron transport family protein
VPDASRTVYSASPLESEPRTPAGTFLGGVVHTLPFLIADYPPAVLVAAAAVALEPVLLAYLRHCFFFTGFGRPLGAGSLAGVLIAGVSAVLGSGG